MGNPGSLFRHVHKEWSHVCVCGVVVLLEVAAVSAQVFYEPSPHPDGGIRGSFRCLGEVDSCHFPWTGESRVPELGP